MCISILLSACSSENQGFEKQMWLSAFDAPGSVYLGVLDLVNKPYAGYIVSYQDDKTKISIKHDSIYFDSTFYGTIFYQQNNIIAIETSNDESVYYHSIPDLNNADSLSYVRDFLVNNPVLYSDEYTIKKVYYDTAVDEGGWNTSFSIDSMIQLDIFNSDNWTRQIDFNFHTKWHLTTLNNSIILLNSPTALLEGFSFDILLIENVESNKLTAKKVEIPFVQRERIQDSISSNSSIDFEYEICTFEKCQAIQPERKKKSIEVLSSRTWTSNTPDSTNYIGKGSIPKHDTIRAYPQTLVDFSFTFHPDYSYEFAYGGVSYQGVFEVSKDGEYLILDKSSNYPSCIRFNYKSNEALYIQLFANVQTEGRRYERYNCYLTFK